MIIIISSIILLVALIFIVWGCAEYIKWLAGLGFILLFLSIVVGFLFGGALICMTASDTPVKFTYAKTKSAVLVDGGGMVATFSDAYTFNTISDSSKVHLVIEYNSYGREIKRYLTIVHDL